MSTTKPPDSQQISESAFLASQHAAHLPPVDTSRIEHGVAPVKMTGVTPAEVAAAPKSGADVEQQLFGRPTFEIDTGPAFEWGPDGKLIWRKGMGP